MICDCRSVDDWCAMSAAVVLIACLIVATTARAQTQLAKLTAGDAVPLDKFGKQVAISEDENTVVVVAFPLEDFPFTIETGSAYVFVGSGTSWTQQAKLTAGDLLARGGLRRRQVIRLHQR